MSISVKNITKKYGEQFALDQVSFEVKKGEVIGFLGPNGAGKSTMMKILTGYIPATSGGASVCDLTVGKDDIAIKKRIGYLPEHNPLYLDMFVKEYLTYCARTHKLKDIKKRVAEIVETTGLTLEQNKKIGQLSKGYRQRVGLAQALIHDPDVLILDEPTTGLDPNQLVDIRALIKNVGESKTVMLSTHIMQEVEAICDRVVIINKGNIVANKRMDEMTLGDDKVIVEFNKPIETTSLSEALNLSVELTGSKVYSIIIKGESIDAIEQKVFNWAVKNERTIRQFKKQTVRLEDYFKELTK